MRDADDGIVLTDREREALAGLAESIGDPWLARQLAGQDEPAPRPPRRPLWPSRMLQGALAGWVGVLLTLAGAVLTVTTFAFSTLAASLGLAVMGVGLWRVVVDQGEGIIRRLSARRPRAARPSPPRTPPAAA